KETMTARCSHALLRKAWAPAIQRLKRRPLTFIDVEYANSRKPSNFDSRSPGPRAQQEAGPSDAQPTGYSARWSWRAAINLQFRDADAPAASRKKKKRSRR